MKQKGNVKRGIFLRTFAGFLAFYLVMMSIFTIMQKQAYDREYDRLIGGQRTSIEQSFFYNKTDYEEAKLNESDHWSRAQEENYRSGLVRTMNSIFSYGSAKGVYGKGAIFTKEGEVVAKSGNSLRIQDSSQPFVLDDGSVRNYSLHRYIDLDQCLTPQEIEELFHITQQEWMDQEKQPDQYIDTRIDVEGYVDGFNVYPQKISLYKQTWKSTGGGGYSLEEESFWKEYTFEVKDKEGLAYKEFSWCQPEFEVEHKGISVVNEQGFTINPLENWDISPTSQERYAQCIPATDPEILKLMGEDGFYIQKEKTFYKTVDTSVMPLAKIINKPAEEYIAIMTVYYPWEVVIPAMIPVYIFSLMMVIVLSWILSRKLYLVYEQQQKLEENRRRLTDGIAHEIKTPLGIIRSYSEGLQEKIAEEKRDKYLQVIIDEVEHIDDMVVNMLEISKLESQQYVLSKETLLIDELVQDGLEKQQKLFDDRGVIVELDISNQGSVEADPVVLRQVINNFLINALQHTPTGGKVNIAIEQHQVSITNEGELIPEEKLPYIWDSFYRVDNSRSRNGGGTGLGLAIAKHGLERHGMEFGVENVTGGVRFWFKF